MTPISSIMTTTSNASGLQPTDALAPETAPLLRQLATRAMGMTGADIERIVRQARLTARREKRALRYEDLEAGLRDYRPTLPYDTRWRYAIHEAGHAVVHHALGLGDVTGLTVDAQDGGYNMLNFSGGSAGTLAWHEDMMAMLMAGRAAELLLLTSASTGSAGADHSDLAKATDLGLAMEAKLGFGGVHPLLYLSHTSPAQALTSDRDLADRVHARIETGLELAMEVIKLNRPPMDALVRALFGAQALDGPAVMAILRRCYD
ncbi:ATP-dependent Zn protease [Rhizobium sp. Leaf384]|uniref:ATP-dependent Zn protease n=1 Tax=Rhizobium sp. Leaf384 TaxID=1736358 RepID=UPI000AB55850|nr:ATP-dependent Zn protease [Rhizobium sp. Leaf384]